MITYSTVCLHSFRNVNYLFTFLVGILTVGFGAKTQFLNTVSFSIENPLFRPEKRVRKGHQAKMATKTFLYLSHESKSLLK